MIRLDRARPDTARLDLGQTRLKRHGRVGQTRPCRYSVTVMSCAGPSRRCSRPKTGSSRSRTRPSIRSHQVRSLCRRSLGRHNRGHSLCRRSRHHRPCNHLRHPCHHNHRP
jgi:hypothetical protein